jgi:Leucine-rich repeat (LRR) protein
MKSLVLRFNEIRELPEELFHLKGLENLSLDYNKVESLSESVSNLV